MVTLVKETGTLSTFARDHMRWAILYHLYNLKNIKNPHGGVPATLLKVTLIHGCFSRFLNCTNGTKLRKTSHYAQM